MFKLKPQLRLAVNVSQEANQDAPIAVDLVSVNDKDLAKDVAKMTAADWFQKRSQIQEDYPDTSKVNVRSWEWVPNQVVADIQIPMRKAPRAIFIFANYSTPGPHRAKIAPSIAQQVSLTREDIKVEPLAK